MLFCFVFHYVVLAGTMPAPAGMGLRRICKHVLFCWGHLIYVPREAKLTIHV